MDGQFKFRATFIVSAGLLSGFLSSCDKTPAAGLLGGNDAISVRGLENRDENSDNDKLKPDEITFRFTANSSVDTEVLREHALKGFALNSKSQILDDEWQVHAKIDPKNLQLALTSSDPAPFANEILVGLPFLMTDPYEDARASDMELYVTSPDGKTSALTSPTLKKLESGGFALMTKSIDGIYTLQKRTGTANLSDAPQNKKALYLEILPADLNLAKGASREISAEVVFSDASRFDATDEVSWNVDQKEILQISGNKITGVAVGAATLSASLANLSNKRAVKVSDAKLERIELDASATVIPQGRSAFVKVHAIYADGTKTDVTSKAFIGFSNPAILQLVKEGEFTALATGDTVISATYLGLSEKVSLRVVTADLYAIQISPNSASLAKGKTVDLQALAIYSNGSKFDITPSVKWTISDASLLKLIIDNDKNTQVQGLETGTVEIVAHYGELQASTKIIVKSADLEKIDVVASSATLPLGTSTQLQVIGKYSDNHSEDITSSAIWVIEDSEVAAIDTSKSITTLLATKLGGSKITAQAGSFTNSVGIFVVEATPVEFQVFAKNEVTLVPAGIPTPFVAQARFTDGSIIDVTSKSFWSVDDASFAKVDNSPGYEGVVTGLMKGQSIAVRASFAGLNAVGTINIGSAELDTLSIQSTTNTLVVGSTLPLQAIGVYTDGATADLTRDVLWQSTNLNILSVDNGSEFSGLTKAASVGTATVTATLGKKMATKVLTVSLPEVSPSPSPSSSPSPSPSPSPVVSASAIPTVSSSLSPSQTPSVDDDDADDDNVDANEKFKKRHKKTKKFKNKVKQLKDEEKDKEDKKEKAQEVNVENTKDDKVKDEKDSKKK